MMMASMGQQLRDLKRSKINQKAILYNLSAYYFKLYQQLKQIMSRTGKSVEIIPH